MVLTTRQLDMIVKITFLFILFVSLNSFSFNDTRTEQKREKKLNKSVKAIWDESARLIPISLPLKDHGLNKFEAIIQGTDTLGIAFSGRVFSCRSGGCQINMSDDEGIDKGPSEYFDAIIIFDKKNIVKKVEVYNYKATHGQEVSARSWLKQFIDYKGGSLRYGKDIDALSGATISAENLTNEVVRIATFLNSLK